MKKLDKKITARIPELYLKSHCLLDVAKTLGVSTMTVRRYAVTAGVFNFRMTDNYKANK